MIEAPATWVEHMRRALGYSVSAVVTFAGAGWCAGAGENVPFLILMLIGLYWLGAARRERLRAWRSL